ncbi:MAG: class I SAM-dependent methyltransferase [Anaerolineales bacterium]|nr:class I SAM-dependent methyltransferase [Anaerolineales bacterium]
MIPEARLQRALAARAAMLDDKHEGAWRLFNGFTEGWPELAVDVLARTLIVHDYAAEPLNTEALAALLALYREALPWLAAAVVKPRQADLQARRGRALFGQPDRRLREDGVRYAVDVLLNRDTGFYLDTRGLRAWLRANAADKTVLNAFAYTGSLGAAALAGGAAGVVQLDRARSFLNLAKETYTLNGFPIHKADFVVEDFFVAASRWRRAERTFDLVLLDPPPFAESAAGVVDLQSAYGRLLNKARPLVADGGALIAINNALFSSGADFLRVIEAASADGYLSLEATLPVPPDLLGFGDAPRAWPTDPSPFNHPTKIAVVRVRRKA